MQKSHASVAASFLIALGYLLTLSDLWALGLLIIFSTSFLAGAFRGDSSATALRRLAFLGIIVLLAISTAWCSAYQAVVDFVVSLEYPEGVALYLLPNLSLMASWMPQSSSIYLGVAVALNACLLLSAVLIAVPEARTALRLDKLLHSFRPSTKMSAKLLSALFAAFSLACIALTLCILLNSSTKLLLFAKALVFPMRYASVAIPFLAIPLVLLIPSATSYIDNLLSEEVFRMKSFGIKCYHLFLIATIFAFLLINYSIAPPEDPCLCMYDDRLYHSIWLLMREGKSFYEAWAVHFPTNPVAHMHLSLVYFMWLCCSSVTCVKMEYFLVCSPAIAASFFLIRRITGSSFFGALSALYTLSFFSIRISWFMPEQWAASPAILGFAMLPLGRFFESAALLTLAFFFKETLVPALLVAALVYSAPLLVWRREWLKSRLWRELSFLIFLGFVVAFVLVNHGVYLCAERTKHFLEWFAPHVFIHEISWFMFPIGLINFLLALAGLAYAVRRSPHSLTALYLLIATLFTHILFIIYIGGLSTEASARHVIVAPLIEFVTAPLAFWCLAED